MTPPPPPPPPPDAASIQHLVRRLLHPKDRDDLRALVDATVAPDVQFWHTLGFFQGRDAYYSALRVAMALWRYEVSFEDVFVSAAADGEQETVKAALAMVLRLRLPFLPRWLSPPLDFPTIATLQFERRRDEEGSEAVGGDGGGHDNESAWQLTRHADANSLVALITAPLGLFAARWLLPALGCCGVAVARALDLLADERDSLGGWLLRPLQLLID